MNSFVSPLTQDKGEITKTIKARFAQGKIEPLEKVKFFEGDELIITIRTITPALAPRKSESQKWSDLSTMAFAQEWENKKDTIYDNWRKHYHVSKR